MTAMDHDTELVFRFVTTLNRRGLEPLFDRDVPEELRVQEVATMPGMFEWEIRPADDNPWVPRLEARLPSRLPSIYRCFISRFRFAELEVGPITFFANTGQQTVFRDICRASFADEGLRSVLHADGLIQFGKQAGGGYDPVCFDMKRRRAEDAPIIRVDHEAILMRGRIRVVRELAPSFRDLVDRAIAGEFPRRA